MCLQLNNFLFLLFNPFMHGCKYICLGGAILGNEYKIKREEAPARVNWGNLDNGVIQTVAIPIQNKNPVRIASFSNSLTTITISYSFIIWLSNCDQTTPHILVITTTVFIAQSTIQKAINFKFRQGKPLCN